jgi:hypothetical protein
MTAPDITINRHRGNPESSEASRSIEASKPLLRLQVEALLRLAGPGGLTSEQVERRLGLSHQTASARISELFARGNAVRGERRMTTSGRWARAAVHIHFANDSYTDEYQPGDETHG